MGLNTVMIEVCTESWKTHHSQNGVEADTNGKAGDIWTLDWRQASSDRLSASPP